MSTAAIAATYTSVTVHTVTPLLLAESQYEPAIPWRRADHWKGCFLSGYNAPAYGLLCSLAVDAMATDNEDWRITVEGMLAAQSK